MENEAKYRMKKKMFREYLRWVYNAINKELFDGELPKIPIRVQCLDDDCYAVFHICSYIDSFYIGDKRHSHRVEHISIEFDNKMAYCNDIAELHIRSIDTMFHEMIHEYNYLHGITDVTDATVYHNSNFLVAMEEHGGICDNYHDIHGFYGSLQKDALWRVIAQIEGEAAKAMARSEAA